MDDAARPGVGDAQELVDAATRLHQTVQSVRLPTGGLALTVMHEARDRALRLLESYAMPRLATTDEPPLVVVIGGPTGAGKSTLTNSLVGAPVSLSGVLRPTTRQPVMIYNPLDAEALVSLGLRQDPERGEARQNLGDASRWVDLRAVPHPDVPQGLAVIDSPDLDSRVDRNRQLAERLLAVADMWLFVTTGTDYADAMSWGMLAEAARRRMPLAVVLNRLRDAEVAQVRRHFATLLTEAGLAHAHMFTLLEVPLFEGRLPVHVVLPLQRWLETTSRTHRGTRPAASIAPVLDSSLGQVVAAVHHLADAADDQVVTARRLRVDVEAIFSHARERVRARCTDASLVTEEVTAAWRATTRPGVENPGHKAHAAASGAGKRPGLLRRRKPVEDPWTTVRRALREAIGRLVAEQLDLAMFRIAERWSDHSAITADDARTLAQPSADVTTRVDRTVDDWLAEITKSLGRQESEPVTLAIATLAVESGPGRAATDPRGFRQAVRRPLAALEPDQPAALAREAWLDLVAALNSVMLQEEARLSDLFDESHVLPEVAAMLRESADAVTAALARDGEPAS